MNATTPTIDLTADIIDVRDIIARVEELETEREALVDAHADTMVGDTILGGNREAALAIAQWDVSEDGIEYAALVTLLDELKGNGGDEQWRGDWYPLTLIADSYFEDYARELADDIGAINGDATWPNNCIDWERAASELQQDYSSVTVDGDDYWYR